MTTESLAETMMWNPQEATADGGQVRRLFFHGTGGSLFGIYIVNIFLTIVTFGVYYFWGKAKVRSYLLSQTEFTGDRLAYHGTGKELLIGFLKAALILGGLRLLMFLPSLLNAGEVIEVLITLLAAGMIFVFVPLAMVGTRRYRLSRISWRGIRFSFRGEFLEFVKLFLRGAFLTMISLGLYYPFFVTQQHAFMVSRTYFGNRKFDFDGRGRDLFRGFVLAYLLYLPTLGLYWFWFLAQKQRYFWEHTSFGGARFRSTVTGGRLLLLHLGNLLLLIVTLGLGRPWVIVRNAHFISQHLTLEGPLDLADIQQEAQVASTTGEGLASFLDLDFGFDFV
ncbi:MAG: YjgN family protein [Candidatus Methylomirabilales bacterium]